MLFYARSDTHYLLFIYDNLRNLLLEQGGEDMLRQCLSRSEQTALRLFEREVYDAETGRGSNGWEGLVKKYGQSLGSIPKAVVIAVHKWRDQIARELDESTK